jgi:hypothetical protein
VKNFVHLKSCSPARLLGGLSLVLAIHGAAQAGDLITLFANSDFRPVYDAPVPSGMLIDWNRDFIIYSNLNAENAGRLPLPSLTPDAPQSSNIDESTDESNRGSSSDESANDDSASGNEADQARAEGTNSDATDGSGLSAETSNGQTFSDYYRYMFGRYGECYGNPVDRSSAAEMPDENSSARSADETDNPGDSRADAVNSDEGNSDTVTSDDAAKDEAVKDEVATDETKSVEVKPEEPKAADETSRRAGTDVGETEKGSNSETANNSSDNGSVTQHESVDEDCLKAYYHFRDEPIEGQFGENRGSAAKEEEPRTGSTENASEDNDGEDCPGMSDDAGDDETTNEVDRIGDRRYDRGNASMGDALLDAITQAANEFAANHGLNLPQILNLLPRM